MLHISHETDPDKFDLEKLLVCVILTPATEPFETVCICNGRRGLNIGSTQDLFDSNLDPVNLISTDISQQKARNRTFCH